MDSLFYFDQLCKMAARELICIFLLVMKVSTQQAQYYQQLSTQPHTYSNLSPQTQTPNSYTISQSPSSYTSQCSNPQPCGTSVSSSSDVSSISSAYYLSSQPVSSSPVDVQTYVQSAAPTPSSYCQYPSASVTAPSPQYITTTSSPMDASSKGSIDHFPSSQSVSYFTATSSPLAAPSVNSVSYIQSDQPVSYSSSQVTATSSPVEVSYVKPASSTSSSPYIITASSNDLSSMASTSYIQSNPSVPSPVESNTKHQTYLTPNHTSKPRCTMISGGKIIEVPCYTLLTESNKALPAEVLPVETPKPIKETSNFYQHPPCSSQNPTPITAEPIPPTNPPIPYPCPLCSALQNKGAKNIESSIMPPPSPSPLIPGILNDIPSTFPPQKPICNKTSSVKSNKPQKPNPQEGPLIYLPFTDEGKLLEKLLTGLGY